MDIHGNLAFRGAISEEEAVFVREADGVRLVEGGVRRRGEIPKGEEEINVFGIDDAEIGILLEFHKDLD